MNHRSLSLNSFLTSITLVSSLALGLNVSAVSSAFAQTASSSIANASSSAPTPPPPFPPNSPSYQGNYQNNPPSQSFNYSYQGSTTYQNYPNNNTNYHGSDSPQNNSYQNNPPPQQQPQPPQYQQSSQYQQYSGDHGQSSSSSSLSGNQQWQGQGQDQKQQQVEQDRMQKQQLAQMQKEGTRFARMITRQLASLTKKIKKTEAQGFFVSQECQDSINAITDDVTKIKSAVSQDDFANIQGDISDNMDGIQQCQMQADRLTRIPLMLKTFASSLARLKKQGIDTSDIQSSFDSDFSPLLAKIKSSSPRPSSDDIDALFSSGEDLAGMIGSAGGYVQFNGSGNFGDQGMMHPENSTQNNNQNSIQNSNHNNSQNNTQQDSAHQNQSSAATGSKTFLNRLFPAIFR